MQLTHRIKDRFFTYCNKLLSDDLKLTNKWKRVDCDSCMVKVFKKRIGPDGKWAWVPLKNPVID